MAKAIDKRPLFILEMANNHMGSVEHGKKIIAAMRQACEGFPFQFAIKLQYRDVDAGIHPAYKNRYDLKFVKRFSETRLSWDEYKALKDAMDEAGFTSVCTPWDEGSVDRIEEHGYDFIKIASCYFTDWPLIERIAKSDRPVIGSAAGVELENIDKVVSFFRHRDRPFSLMHCVGEYPTPDDKLELGQIALLRERYPGLEIGYSTHERPDNYDGVMIAIGLGATMFEKHVGVPTDTIQLNTYSATHGQVKSWLQAALAAHNMIGHKDRRAAFAPAETRTLHDLQRGVFTKQAAKQGEAINPDGVFYAMPSVDGQLVANDMSKYASFRATAAIDAGAPVMWSQVQASDHRKQLYRIVGDVRKILKRSKVVVPGQCELEVSHHYGIDRFDEFGSTVITVVNRQYCKRVIVLLPGQTHPEQWHKEKDETYHILYGEISLRLDGQEEIKKANDVIVIPHGVKHSFTTRTGTVIEEVSSFYTQGDSFYSDESIMANENRKTFVTYWME
jgi:sialic acid synthase SpsE/quercetin dioxygenase-like cupin family protein